MDGLPTAVLTLGMRCGVTTRVTLNRPLRIFCPRSPELLDGDRNTSHPSSLFWGPDRHITLEQLAPRSVLTARVVWVEMVFAVVLAEPVEPLLVFEVMEMTAPGDEDGDEPSSNGRGSGDGREAGDGWTGTLWCRCRQEGWEGPRSIANWSAQGWRGRGGEMRPRQPVEAPLPPSLQQERLQLDRLKTQLSDAIQSYGVVQKVRPLQVP